MNHIKKFIAWPLQEKIIFIKSLCWVGCYFAAVYFLPEKMLKYFIGQPTQYMFDSSSDDIKNQYISLVKKNLTRIIWLLNISNKCLVYALTAKKLLTQKNIVSFLYLGVKQKDGKLHAHAWLISHKIDIVGCEQIQDYQVIGIFKDKI